MIVETPDGFRWKFEAEAAPKQVNNYWFMYQGKRWIKSKQEWSKGKCSSGAYESFKIIEE